MASNLGRSVFKILTSPSQSRQVSSVRIVEVGPRDGLQNESVNIPTPVKIDFINRLSETGLKAIEVTSFVSPKWIPQMGDNSEVFSGITKKGDIAYPVLIPNMQGLEAALEVGAKEIAVFASASDGFSRKNTNCSALEGIEKIKSVIALAKTNHVEVRGYVSCVVGCPYDGVIQPRAVTKVAETLLAEGCYEISLGDTIGVATKATLTAMLKDVLKVTTADKLAIHLHDTYGQALVNIYHSLENGISVVDSSVAGLGGCPYAKGATGNVATEDVVYMLDGMGVETNVDLKKLVETGRFISDAIGKPPASRVNNALYQKYFL